MEAKAVPCPFVLVRSKIYALFNCPESYSKKPSEKDRRDKHQWKVDKQAKSGGEGKTEKQNQP